MRSIILGLTILMSPVFAAAQEVTGTIAATLNGEERTWFITETPQMSQSDWKDFGYQASVSLLGHSTDNTVTSSHQALMVKFEYWGSDGAYTISAPEVVYLSQGMMKAHVGRQEDGVQINITSAEVNGDRLKIEGTISGDLIFTEVMMRKKDPNDVLSVEGSFSADLGPVR